MAFPKLTFAGDLYLGPNNPSFVIDVSTSFPMLAEVGYPVIPVYSPSDELVVFTGNVTLTSNADVAAFAAGNYDSIHGNLTISDGLSGNLTSLAGLEKLNYVTGDVDIHDNSVLPNANGLNAFVRCDGDFKIRNNAALLSFGSSSNGLEWITYVGGDFIVDGNTTPQVSNDGFKTLTFIGGGIRWTNNTGSSTLSGFNRLTSVDYIVITGNASVSVGYFANRLLSLPNALDIEVAAFQYENNSGAGNIDGVLQRLTSVGTGGIRVKDNALFDGLYSSFRSVTSLTGDIVFQNNANMTALQGCFMMMTTLGGPASNLIFEDLPALPASGFAGSFAVLENAQNLQFINVQLLKFGANTGFDNTEQPFTKMTSLRSLLIDGCASLTWLGGLKTLIGSQVTPGPVVITNNATLPTTAQVAAFGTYLSGSGYVGTFTNTGNGPG